MRIYLRKLKYLLKRKMDPEMIREQVVSKNLNFNRMVKDIRRIATRVDEISDFKQELHSILEELEMLNDKKFMKELELSRKQVEKGETRKFKDDRELKSYFKKLKEN